MPATGRSPDQRVLVSVVGVCLGLGADLSICDRSAALPLSHPHQRSGAGAQLPPLCL